MYGSPLKMWDSMKWPKPEDLLYLLDKEKMNLWRLGKRKGFGLGIVNGGQVTSLVHRSFQALNSLSGDKNGFHPPNTGRVHFTWGIHLLLSTGTKEARNSLLAPAISQVPLLQNKQYTKITCFGVSLFSLSYQSPKFTKR